MDDAYANLVLPGLLRQRGITGRDAAFATELAYGTLRARGVLDEIIVVAAKRPLESIERPVLDVLRLGAYQLLRTRIPAHAAVASTVDLCRAAGSARAAGFVNAVLRSIGRASWDEWIERLSPGRSPLEVLALRHAHPVWIVEAFDQALGGDPAELEAALAADDARPRTHLVAWPGRISAAELAAQVDGVCAPADGIRSPYAVRMRGGDPGGLPALRSGAAAVQDEGSQLVAIALAQAPIGDGPDRAWLDICAGPGGKAALLGALAAPRGARVLANELHPHRAQLIREVIDRASGSGHRADAPLSAWPIEVRVGDARTLAGQFDRVLVDAPCTGLGALRRRPEARWRRQPEDVAQLAQLQGELLLSALRLTRPGGVVAYATCSPHQGETTEVVARALDEHPGLARQQDAFQLWPHRDGTDAMFCALLRRL